MSDETSAPSARALRAMAIVRWLILAAAAGVAALTWWTMVLHAGAPASGEPRFYCPMHPDIRSHEPGTCPICFMSLEPIPADLRAGAPDAGTAGPEELVEPPPGSLPDGTAPVMLTTERRQASGIAVAVATRRATAGETRWPATVEALEGARAEVRVRTDAFVEHVVVSEPGVTVRRGQVLAWIYAPEILRAEEELLAAHAWHDGDDPSAGVEPAASRRLELLGVSAADVAAILRSGETRRTVAVRAPSSGIVTAFDAVRGTYATPETVLYEITDYERVYVVATVLSPSELEVAGAGATFHAADGSDVPLELYVVEPTLAESARGARVRYLASNLDGALRPGAIGDVVVSSSAGSALVVPRDAVIDRGHVRYVFVETGSGTFEPRVVEAGPIRGDEREIVAGLDEGERVVTRGAFVLDAESRLAAALAPMDTRPDAGPPEGSP